MNNHRGNDKSSSDARSLYVTLALAMVVLAALVALTGVWRSSKDADALDSDGVQVIAQHNTPSTKSPDTTHTEPVTTAKAESETVTDAAAEATLNFVAPVDGSLVKGHSGDTPVFSLTMNDYRRHTGVDIAASIGADVYAAADGEIGAIWEDPMCGTCMSIKHAGDAVSIYRNLSPEIPDNIAVGVRVSAGEAVASVGESSLVEIAEECHLHYELEIGGESVDPTEYVSIPTSDEAYEG